MGMISSKTSVQLAGGLSCAKQKNGISRSITPSLLQEGSMSLLVQGWVSRGAAAASSNRLVGSGLNGDRRILSTTLFLSSLLEL